AENERLAILAGQPNQLNQPDELARLRRDVGALRQQTNELAMLTGERRRLRAQFGPQTPLQLLEETRAKIEFEKSWLIAFRLYALNHSEQFPTTFEQAENSFPKELRAQNAPPRDQFEIVHQGSMMVTNTGDFIAVREKEPWQDSDGKWTK